MDHQDFSGRHCCIWARCVLCFFVLLFFIAVGLILGAIFAPIILGALSAVIAFSAAIAAGIIALLIYCHKGCK